MRKSKAIFTIGYSNMEIGAFIKRLQHFDIDTLIDIRTIPRSRHQPYFNADRLAKRLSENGISYEHWGSLTGLRKPNGDPRGAAWINASFRGFADYMQTNEFRDAIIKLIKHSHRHKIVLMCAEGNPFRCHRRLIADALYARGIKAFHIQSSTTAKEHTLTAFAKVYRKRVMYPVAT
ncbi:MAG: DUF488 domain-containing protein [Candidatus Micrarchaeaceae archaeon]